MLGCEGIIGLSGYEILKMETRERHRFEVRYTGEASCPYCQSLKLRKKDVFTRFVRHLPVGDKLSELVIRGFKFLCLACKKYFNQRFPGILPRRRSTEPFRRYVSQKHHDGISQRTLSQRVELGMATIERWYQDFVEKKAAELKGRAAPKIVGIDEHYFTRSQGFATTLVDLRKHRVFDVMLGRSEKSLERKLSAIPLRENTKVVVMDLSSTYRQIARRFFPRAMIVADRFHVIRLINQHFLEVWKMFDQVGRKNRGLMSLMRRHEWNLSPFQKEKLALYIDQHPGFRLIYEMKQRLCHLLTIKHQTAKQCRGLIPEYLSIVEHLRSSPMQNLKTLGDTLFDWREEIARMWRFTKTNSITEGFHNKMEMISRRAFGFRNFENYRLRVQAHCG